ncbi:MAG: antibiotic biosynthesis monooxygenase [Bacteroidetes bacterium]|nr:antibiotic biosynthesis monooxygenase [Bacteroidota bacterium]
MLIRIVKMTFAEGKADDFIAEFNRRKSFIAASEGCAGVDLLRDINTPNVFFTYSKWKDEASLEAYRNSPLFDSTWETVKKWFADRPEAWSMRTMG